MKFRLLGKKIDSMMNNRFRNIIIKFNYISKEEINLIRLFIPQKLKIIYFSETKTLENAASILIS
jgi:hypothetical protein